MTFEAMQLLAMWLKQREIQNQSVHTLQAYERDVSDFLLFCEQKKLELGDVEATDLREFIAQKVEYQQLSSSSFSGCCPLFVSL